MGVISDKTLVKFLFVGVLYAALFSGCSSYQPLKKQAGAAKPTSEKALPAPRAVDLVIRGALEELMGNYQGALLAYQEALLYDSTSIGLYISIARTYQRLHKLESAIKVLNKALRLEPNHQEALEELALIYEFQRDYEKAIPLYEKRVAHSPYDVELRIHLATLYSQVGEKKKAIQQFEHLIAFGQGNPEVWRPLARLYLQTKAYDKARTVLQRWLESERDNEEPYLEMGLTYKVQNDTTGLLQWYRKALEANPDFEIVRAELTDLLVDLGRIDEAIELFEATVAADSSDLVRISQLGNLYMQKGDTLKARQLFEYLLHHHPDDWRVYYNLGKLSYDNQQWRETARFLEKAAEMNGKIPLVWLMLGQAYWQMDSLRLAEAALKKVWDFNSRNPQVWLMLGQTYFRMEKLKKAEEAARRAHKLVPDFHFANYLLGLILNRQGRNEDAIPFFENAIRLDSTDINSMGLLAAIYGDLGRYTISDSLYERALKLDPDNPILQNNYSYSLAVRGVRLQEALELVERALEKEPQNGAFLDTKGWVLYQMGKYEEALRYIQESLSVRDDSAEVWEHLGDVYEKLGNIQEAMKAWQRAYELDNNRKTVYEKLNSYR